MMEEQNRETLATVIFHITPEDIYGRPNAPAYDAEKFMDACEKAAIYAKEVVPREQYTHPEKFKRKLLSVAVRKRNEIIRNA
jgi:hypothetical protein